MRVEVSNRIAMLQQEVTAEVEGSPTGTRRWLMLRPSEDGGVMLVQFDVATNVDPDSWLKPSDVRNRQRWDFPTLGEALQKLEQAGINTDSFDAPWKMDYPL